MSLASRIVNPLVPGPGEIVVGGETAPEVRDLNEALAEAIAADGTVAAAAAAAAETAVDAEIAARPLVEGGTFHAESADEPLAASIVDKDGRRTWVEVAPDGGLSIRAVALIAAAVAERVGIALGLEDMDSAITESILAVVDEDGRLTDLELGLDGKFSDRVITSIGERLNVIVPDDGQDLAAIVAPSSIPMLVGETCRLIYADMIEALSADHRVLTNVAGNHGTYWEHTPADATAFTLSLTVVDRAGETVTSREIPIVPYAAPDGGATRLLPIGDSITRTGTYHALAADAVGASTVGTRTLDDGATNTEGRGGWSLATYVTAIGSTTSVDSPFLFPTTVDGDKFLGNTEAWRKICFADPSNYEYEGFQRIARGWLPSGNPYLFDAAGYPVAPTEGDVVIDPTKESGQQYRIYSGGAWAMMSPQPSVAFSFAKYLDRYAAAFPDGPPTVVSILLSTNDFLNGVSDNGYLVWRNRMNEVIDSIHAYDPTIPVIVLLAPVGGPDAVWATQTLQKVAFDRAMREAATRQLEDFDTATKRDAGVYVATFLGAVQPEHMTDFVHPAIPAGHADMAPFLAGTLAKLITEGDA